MYKMLGIQNIIHTIYRKKHDHLQIFYIIYIMS